MKSLLVRRKHVDLHQVLTALSDPNLPAKDAMVMWRKALRRTDDATQGIAKQGREPAPGKKAQGKTFAPLKS